MKKSKFTEAQIIGVFKELDAGTPATTVSRRIGVHANTIRASRDKYAGLETSDLVRLKQLEAENAQLRRIVARKELELDVVRDLIKKNAGALATQANRKRIAVARAVPKKSVRDCARFGASYAI